MRRHAAEKAHSQTHQFLTGHSRMASLAPPGESAQGICDSHQFGWPVTSQKLEPAAESISMQTWWLPACVEINQ